MNVDQETYEHRKNLLTASGYGMSGSDGRAYITPVSTFKYPGKTIAILEGDALRTPTKGNKHFKSYAEAHADRIRDILGMIDLHDKSQIIKFRMIEWDWNGYRHDVSKRIEAKVDKKRSMNRR